MSSAIGLFISRVSYVIYLPRKSETKMAFLNSRSLPHSISPSLNVVNFCHVLRSNDYINKSGIAIKKIVYYAINSIVLIMFTARTDYSFL